MVLEAIPQALWFFVPAFVANPAAVLFGGGAPIDSGRTLRDGERVFGDGKTWRGLVEAFDMGLEAVHERPPNEPGRAIKGWWGNYHV